MPRRRWRQHGNRLLCRLHNATVSVLYASLCLQQLKQACRGASYNSSVLRIKQGLVIPRPFLWITR
jgi:hypothetical protein